MPAKKKPVPKKPNRPVNRKASRLGGQAAVDPDSDRSAFGHYRHCHQCGALHSCVASLVHVLPEHLSRDFFLVLLHYLLDTHWIVPIRRIASIFLHPTVACGVFHSDCDLVWCGVCDRFRWCVNVRKEQAAKAEKAGEKAAKLRRKVRGRVGRAQ